MDAHTDYQYMTQAQLFADIRKEKAKTEMEGAAPHQYQKLLAKSSQKEGSYQPWIAPSKPQTPQNKASTVQYGPPPPPVHLPSNYVKKSIMSIIVYSLRATANISSWHQMSPPEYLDTVLEACIYYVHPQKCMQKQWVLHNLV